MEEKDHLLFFFFFNTSGLRIALTLPVSPAAEKNPGIRVFFGHYHLLLSDGKQVILLQLGKNASETL